MQGNEYIGLTLLRERIFVRQDERKMNPSPGEDIRLGEDSAFGSFLEDIDAVEGLINAGTFDKPAGPRFKKSFVLSTLQNRLMSSQKFTTAEEKMLANEMWEFFESFGLLDSSRIKAEDEA